MFRTDQGSILWARKNVVIYNAVVLNFDLN